MTPSQRILLSLGMLLFFSVHTIGGITSAQSSSSDSDRISNDSNGSTKNSYLGLDKPLRCYTCSWSEMANLTRKNVDACSSYKFVPEAAVAVGCDYGCQTVSYRTTKTAGVRHFHRNCLKKQPGQELKERCAITFSKVYGYEELCECLTNLCNGASTKSGISVLQLVELLKALSVGIILSWIWMLKC